jgi:3-isopropylmalate/(R)-2-methylmalate dehydratase large subunit
VSGPRTLYDKIWDTHVVAGDAPAEQLIYIDLHLIHEVTTPQAFDGLREAGRRVRRPELTLAVADHNVPTEGQADGAGALADPQARAQLEALGANVAWAGIEFFPMADPRNGIVHIVGPEQGRTQPGTTIACGDSHASTHGAVGALALAIGTSEVEHVLATQCLRQTKSRNMRVTFTGDLRPGVSAKDMALAMIAQIGASGAVGHVLEFAGPAVRALSMEGRFTLCNMAIEAGARAGLIAPDESTFAWLKGRPSAPDGAAWEAAVSRWRALPSDADARFDREQAIDVSALRPMISWGTSPDQASEVGGMAPDPTALRGADAAALARSLDYMGLVPGQPLIGLKIDRVFIGSCTNGRIEDLRAAAGVVRGRHKAAHVRVMVVPGSGLIRRQAEREGLDQVFLDAGFEWREPGCSMCLAMNEDRLEPGERCASTSNRNFEGRQGRGGRTHLMSPVMAAAAAIAGHIVDSREFSA